MEIPPLHPVCKRSDKHFGTRPIFDPDYDSPEWKLVPPGDPRYCVHQTEFGFPVYPNQFRDIVNHLTPSEVWTRMGCEIRFVWNGDNSRETLEFIQPNFKPFPRRIEFVFRTEIAGREAVHLHDKTDDLVVRPRVSEDNYSDEPPFKRPPMLLLVQNELRHFHDIHVLMAVMRRGYGPPVHYSKYINTVWVG
jgi:hypothetical protein